MDNLVISSYRAGVLLSLIVPLLLTPDAQRGPEDRLADLAEWAGEMGYLDLQDCVGTRQAEAEASMAFYEAYLAELPELRGLRRAEVEIRMEMAVLDAREREIEAWDVCLGGVGERVLWATLDAGQHARTAPDECVDLAMVSELEEAARNALASMHEHWGSDLARMAYSRLITSQNRLVAIAEEAHLCGEPDYAGSSYVTRDAPAYPEDDTTPTELP